MGEALGRWLELTAPTAQHAPASLLLQAYRNAHAGHGACRHRHRYAAHASGGRRRGHRQRHASRFPPASARWSPDLNDGGVYLNVGSAVVLPEVFLKAVSAVRNLGHPLADFTTVNFDFLQHYRPRVNVVERPHAGVRRPRLRHHRASRDDDSAAGRRADREVTR